MGRLIATALAVYSFVAVQTNIASLPARVPTHFDAAGETNGWGSPSVLWLLFLVQVFICGGFFLLPLLSRRFPASVHFGARKLSDFTPEQREQVLPLLAEMMGTLSVPVSLLFSYLIHEMIRVASAPHPELPLWWAMGIFLTSNAAILIYYLRRINAAADGPSVMPRQVA